VNFIYTIFLVLISSIFTNVYSQENVQQTGQRKQLKVNPISDTVLVPSIKKNVLKEGNTPTNTIKSTVYLNLKTTINENQTSYQSLNKTKKITRFKVDCIMFNFLLEGLNETLIIDNKNIKVKKDKLRKKNTWNKRKLLLKEMKFLKKKRKAVEGEIVSVTKKIKKINSTVLKGDLKYDEDFVFDGNINNKDISLSNSENLIYKVQIGVYKNKISKKIFKGLFPVFEDSFDGGVRYSVGAFKKLLYAKQAKKYVVNLGLEDAFIISFLNGKRIPINKAIDIEK